jgi:adenosine deaminase
VQAGIVPSIARHPLARLHRAGVGVTLSTDDATVSDTSLTDEYGRCADEMGLSLPELWAIDRHALAVAFADETTIARLDASFEVWAAGRAEVRGDPRQPTPG